MVLLHLFHNQGRGRPIGGGAGIQWLLNDSFTDTLATGSVNGTPAVPGPGTRVVVDTGGDEVSLSGGNLVFSNPNGAWDAGLWLDAVTRTAGLLLVCELKPSDHIIDLGFDTNQAGQIGDDAVRVRDDNNVYPVENGTQGPIVGTFAASTSYKFAIVLKNTGSYMFIKGGIFTNWTLLWIASTDNTATIYPALSNFTSTSISSFLRVPQQTWLPSPLCYDTFTDDNGTSLDAHSSDTSGPDGQSTPSKSWTEESGDWDIQSNRANPDGAALATVDAGQADVLVDLVVNGGAAGQPAILLRFSDTSNYWFLQADRANDQFELHEYNATVDTVRANAAVTFNDSTDYDLRAICDGQTIDGFADGGNKISYGSASLNETKTEHGLYSDNTVCEFDDFLVFTRDSGYGTLNRFTG